MSIFENSSVALKPINNKYQSILKSRNNCEQFSEPPLLIKMDVSLKLFATLMNYFHFKLLPRFSLNATFQLDFIHHLQVSPPSA